MGYIEMSADDVLQNMRARDTWIIAFCPDNKSFFATNLRAFFWESEEEFDTEANAIDYFEKRIAYFCYIASSLTNELQDKIYLENTGKWY